MRSFYDFRELSVQSNTKVQHSTIQLSGCIGCVSSQTLAVRDLVVDDVERLFHRCAQRNNPFIGMPIYTNIILLKIKGSKTCYLAETQNNMLYSMSSQLLQWLMFSLIVISVLSGTFVVLHNYHVISHYSHCIVQHLLPLHIGSLTSAH